MNAHEKLIAAARASSVAARELGLPHDAPEVGVEHDTDNHLARIEKALAKSEKARQREATANRDLRLAVIDHGRKTSLIFRAVVVLAVVSLAVGGVVVSHTRELAERNREAIRVSCTLLTNAIIESGGGGRDQAPASDAARAQRRITAILIGAITRGLLTDAERAEVARLGAIVAKAGGVVAIPDCNEIALHPKRVRELLLSPQTREPARRSPPTTP